MATLVAAKHNLVNKEFYERLLAAKPKRAALVACMLRLLLILGVVLR